jgi:hypothetical protein
MKIEEYIALGTLITVIASALALVIKQVEQSRCTQIKCCGMECDRRVVRDEQPPQVPEVDAAP